MIDIILCADHIQKVLSETCINLGPFVLALMFIIFGLNDCRHFAEYVNSMPSYVHKLWLKMYRDICLISFVTKLLDYDK